MTVKTKRMICLLALSLVVSSVGWAGFTNETYEPQSSVPTPSTIDRLDGNPTPSACESMINNYLFQDEQVNVGPDDGELRVLRTDQKILLNEYATKLIPVKNVSVRELRPIAREICAMEGGFAEVVQDKVKKLYWVQVTTPAWQLPYVEAAILALDKEWLNATDDGSALVRYDAKYRDLTNSDYMARRYLGVPASTSVEDELENTMTHTDNPANAGAWEAIMKATDLPESDIKVDAEFVEVSTNNDLKMGVDYIAWKNGPGRNLFEFIFAGLENVERYRGASSIYNPLTPTIFPPANGDSQRFETNGRQRYASYNYWLTSAYFDFLKSKGVAKSLMRATLRARSGQYAQEGEVSQVLSFAVTGENDKWSYDGNRRGRLGNDEGDLGAWDRFVNYVNSGRQVGMFITIFPMVGLETTEMYVDARVSEVVGYTPQKLPMIAEQSVTTDVRVKDGESLLLAGLKRTEKVKQKAGAPWLCDIPILGYLFGGETSLDRATDIVVTLDTTTGVQTADMTKEIVMLEDEMLVAAQAQGTEALATPKNPFGFDQWLLDPAD
ncbi:hypothetical protein JW916_04595 [Candidatus Sumerlaeota bacterium]|nr:hypothetical protein [Candidatus Sumerlaeota bacterium]